MKYLVPHHQLKNSTRLHPTKKPSKDCGILENDSARNYSTEYIGDEFYSTRLDILNFNVTRAQIENGIAIQK